MNEFKNINQQLSAPEQGVAKDTAENMNLLICADYTQSLNSDEMSVDLPIPVAVKGTLLTDGYYLTILCLCWLLRNAKHCENRFTKIKNVAELKKRSDIFKCLKDINENNHRGRVLLKRMERINPILLAAGISYIIDLKNAGELTPHHFCAARNFDCFTFQVPIKEPDFNFRTFNVFDYERFIALYRNEDGTFDVSQAITSLFTDIVLSCFMDCTPNLHLVSSGSKLTFADLTDLGELEFETSNGTQKKLKDIYYKLDLSASEPCARAATVSLKNHKYFKHLYLNDADLRFYNFLWCMKNYPLYVISEILICDCDKKLNELRKAAKAEAIARQQAKDRGETLGKLPDGSSLVKIREFLAAHCNAFSNSVRDRVRAAAWLFLWVNMSFSGNFDSGISKDRIYINNLNSKLSEMLSAVLVLQKAEISCMDCVDFMKRFIDMNNFFWFVDTPYVLNFGSACKTYSIRLPKNFVPKCGRRIIKDLPPFGIDKIKALFSLAAQAEGRVLITHSAEHEVEYAAYCVGLDYLFSYSNKANGSNEKGYVTNVFSKNIHEDGFVCSKNEKSISLAYTDEWMNRMFSRQTKELQQLKADGVGSAKDFANTCTDQTGYKGKGK